MSSNNLLTFTKKELNGLLIFCLLLLLIIMAPFIYSIWFPAEVYQYEDFRKEIANFKKSAVKNSRSAYLKKPYKDTPKPLNPQYFKFNPNNLPEESWRKLGLSERQIKVIKNFEAKGGKFYRKESLQKIYSITPEDYARLEPYIDIAVKVYPASLEKKNNALKESRLSVIELNSTDSIELDALPGIGPAFVSRIIKYRTRLGGFYQKEQLMEVYGLDSNKFQVLKDRIAIDQGNIQKLNVNAASFEDLKRHPYLSYKQMNAIIQYRKQHGRYNSLSDLRKVLLLNGPLIEKMAPYFSF